MNASAQVVASTVRSGTASNQRVVRSTIVNRKRKPAVAIGNRPNQVQIDMSEPLTRNGVTAAGWWWTFALTHCWQLWHQAFISLFIKIQTALAAINRRLALMPGCASL